MIDQMQNDHVELLAALARQGGGYDWRTVPISDSQGGEHSLMLNPYKAEVQEAPPFQGSQVGERIVQLLDKLSRKRKRNDDDYDHSRETSAGHAKRVKAAAGDKRSAAFDLSPLPDEMLHDYHGRLHTLVNPYGPAHAYFGALRGFLERIGGVKKFRQLTGPEQHVLTSIVKHIAAAA
jgi:hypothetical protein